MSRRHLFHQKESVKLFGDHVRTGRSKIHLKWDAPDSEYFRAWLFVT